MKLWHGIVLGVIFFLLGYQIAGALGIPLDARSLAFSGLLTLLVAAVLLLRLPADQRRALFRRGAASEKSDVLGGDRRRQRYRLQSSPGGGKRERARIATREALSRAF